MRRWCQIQTGINKTERKVCENNNKKKKRKMKNNRSRRCTGLQLSAPASPEKPPSIKLDSQKCRCQEAESPTPHRKNNPKNRQTRKTKTSTHTQSTHARARAQRATHTCTVHPQSVGHGKFIHGRVSETDGASDESLGAWSE